MNEEIDVSGCRYYRKDKNCDIWGIPCRMKEFCYFKILKQENTNLKEKLEKIKEIATKYSQHEGYLLDGLFTDIVDELSEVLKDE